MNRRTLLKSVAAGLATLAVSTRLATASIPEMGWHRSWWLVPQAMGKMGSHIPERSDEWVQSIECKIKGESCDFS